MKKLSLPFTKSLAGLCGLIALSCGAHAQQALPFYESFPGTNAPVNGLGYANNEELGVAGTGANGTIWNFGNSASGSSARIATNAFLTYPGLTNIDATFATYGLQSHVASTSSKDRGVPLTLPAATTIYASCLVNFQNFIAGTTPFFGFSPTASGSSVSHSGAVIYYDASGRLHVAKNSTTPTTNVTYALATNTTHLVVLRYKVNTGGNDSVDLWIDPVPLGNDAAVPAPAISTTNNANVATFGSIAYFEGTAPALFNLDEIRVATNWAGVTPAPTWTGHIFGVSGGGSGCPGTAFPINVNGSDTGVTYLLYTNGVFAGTNVDGTGSAISFANQTTTALYTILASNITSTVTAWMSNSAAITVLDGPVITSDISSVIVATNGAANFVATVTGQGLHYNWYKNGQALADGGDISGSTTSNLTIFPATANDAATIANGYKLLVTNSCGLAATSSVAALTLDAAATLYWIGNNPDTNWNLAASSNFSTTDFGAANAVFHSGDNVIFDDSGASFPNVNLVGNFLTPGSVVESASTAFIFSGTGSIAGPTSLIMTGNSLTISNANTFTGGTVLSNGTLVFRNPTFASLGSGTITMAGGTLDIPMVGSAVLGLTNDLLMAADSTLEYDATGSFGCVVFGAITGNPASTLHIFTAQTPSTQSRIRFYNTNMVVNSMISIDSSFTQFAPYNASGSQTYNGVISGVGTIITRNAGATNFFNNTNTYSGNTLLTGGGIGLGANSVSDTNAPTGLDAGPLGVGNISLQTDGSGGSANATLLATGGPRILGNTFTYAGTGTDYTLVLSGSNNLTLTGSFGLCGVDGTGNTNRVLNVNGTGLFTMSGVINDISPLTLATATCGLTKIGVGTLALTATNTYTGTTTITNGTLRVDGRIDVGAVTVETNSTLAGTGTVLGPVTVQLGGTLAPGDGGVGTLAINNSLTLQTGSTTSVEVNKSTGLNDKVTGLTSVTYAGTLNAASLGTTPVIGDSFTIFSTASHSGNFTATNGSPGTGLAWSFDPNTGKLSVIAGPTVATNRAPITITNNGTSLTLSWPADHKGWRLQSETNSLSVGLTTNWVTVANSTNVTQVVVPITTNGTVFFRMVYP